MQIEVKNVKNIKSSKITIEDNKINFLFGISGSGKSTIAEALSKEIPEDAISIGVSRDEVGVFIDGVPVDTSKYELFNQEQVDKLLLSKSESEDAYDILFSNNESFVDAKNEFSLLVLALIEKKPLLTNKRVVLESFLVQDQGISKLNKGDILPERSKPVVIKKAIESLSERTNLTLAQSYGAAKIQWISSGIKLDGYEKSICPFCENEISSKRKSEIEDLAKIDAKLLGALSQDGSTFIKVGVEKPDYFNVSSIESFNDKLIGLHRLLEDIKTLISFIEIDNINDFDPAKVKKIVVREEFKAAFPEISNDIDTINLKIDEIRIQLSKIKSKFKDIVRKNKTFINGRLELLGIPYILVEKPIKPNEKLASYFLKHKHDVSNMEREKNLSFGERNIIALLFFMLKNRRKTIIIDDPASSFDDYRRKSIYDFIIEKSDGRTIIVLSHDHVFIKFATRSKYKDRNPKIGCVQYFKNYNGTPNLVDIHSDDFKKIDAFIMDRVQNTTEYYPRIVGLRILSELDKYMQSPEGKIIYGYLSKILHRKDTRDEILAYLVANSTSESVVLTNIFNRYDISLNPIPSDYIDSIDTSKLTNFEKIFLVREEDNTTEINSELCNIVHLNDSYTICLNPYIFDYFSPYVYSRIVAEFPIEGTNV